MEWYKWNSLDVGGEEVTNQQSRCLCFFKQNTFVFRTVHHLFSLIRENGNDQHPKFVGFVLRIEEAGFKTSNKCLWKLFCSLSFMMLLSSYLSKECEVFFFLKKKLIMQQANEWPDSSSHIFM